MSSSSIPTDIIGLEDVPFGAVHIIFLVFGIIFGILGIGGTLFSIKLTKANGTKMQEAFKVVQDDQLIYPRCAVAAAESNITIATPWKHYFTRDDQPFNNQSPLP